MVIIKIIIIRSVFTNIFYPQVGEYGTHWRAFDDREYENFLEYYESVDSYIY